jgi:choline kinase
VNAVVLAAGAGRRLQGLTAVLPKTLLPVDQESCILDVILANLSSVGLQDVSVVTGFAAERIEERAADFEGRHGVRLSLVFNARAREWNNAYSLWLAREALAAGAVLVNGDTVHPASVEERLLRARGDGAELLLAVDDAKELGTEEMKVLLDGSGRVQRIDKQVEPATAHGEYIGVALVEAGAAAPLADALEATWRRDPSLYYEDGFQEFARRGGVVGATPIGAVSWAEVDDETDLERARRIRCRS